MTFRSIFSCCILLALFISCREENDEAPAAFPDLKIYLDRFEEEARLRGYDFDLSQVEVQYADEVVLENGTPACGIAGNFQGRKTIQISKSENCNWANRTDLERENLFFHEIGHAFFRRGHEETRMCDGSPITLMTSTVNNFRVYQEGEDDKRDYYIAELIDRMAALEQCIQPQQNWDINPVKYDFSKEEQDWFFFSDQDNYSGNRISVTDQSFGDQLTIKAEEGNNVENTGYWYTQFFNPNIPECAEVTFSVRMNSEQLSGPGAALAVRVYEMNNEKQGAEINEFLFLTTEDNPVSGKLDNYVEELTIPCFTRKTVNITVFVVMMPGTQGEVTFDDIHLEVKEQ